MPSKSDPVTADKPSARRVTRAGWLGIGIAVALGIAALLWAVSGDRQSGQSGGGNNSQTQIANVNSAGGEGRPVIGVHSSLPLYWPQEGDFDEILSDDTEPPWPRSVLAQRFQPIPLDNLSDLTSAQDSDGEDGQLSYLIVAQPRALTPADNVALDTWVRGGGRLILVLDPLLLAQSHYPLGDSRAPQATALVPPLLPRWGLEMSWDEQQSPEWAMLRVASPDGAFALPVRSRGTLSLDADNRGGENAGEASCRLTAQGAVARCTIGNGQVIVIADADFLAASDQDPLAESQSALAGFAQMLGAG